MRKSTLVALGVTAAVAGVGVVGVAALDDDDAQPTQAGVCVDRDTNTRVDDDQCDDDSHGHGHVGWYFIPFGLSSPRVGGPVGGGTFDTPRGTDYVTGGVPREGGKVDSSTTQGGKTTTVRGGFGGNKSGSGG